MPYENVQNMFRSKKNITWRSPPECPKCHQLFSSSYIKHSPRRAFILKCDHLMCEKCITDQAHSPGHAAVCKICNIRTILNPKQHLTEQLQYSYQMLGFLYQRQHEISRLANLFPSPKAPGIKPVKEEEDDDDKECYECNVTRTRHFCQECDTPLCRDCFEKIHRVGKVLSKHKLCSLTARKWIQEDISICDEHKLTTILFCTSCEQRVCTACRNASHATHFCANLQDINSEAQPRVERMLTDLQKAYALNTQGIKNAEKVIEKQQEYADKVITQITDYFFSLHNVLQSVEQELLQSVKTNYLKLHEETASVQKELLNTERNLTRSIEQFKTFQIAVPRQVLLSDLIKDMRKMLHTVPVTAEFMEPQENPFQFRERDPLRKEIHNYFELSCKPSTSRHRTSTFYPQEPFPVLEPIDSPEPVLPPLPEPPSTSCSMKSSEGGTGGAMVLNKSGTSSDHAVKDMDISSTTSSRPASPEEEQVIRHVPLGSADSTKSKIKSEIHSKSRAKVAASGAGQRLSVESQSTQGSGIAGTSESTKHKYTNKSQPPPKRKSKTPEVEIVSVTSSGRNTNKAGAFRRDRQKQRSSPATNQKPASAAPPEVAREMGKPILEINPINPDNASFIKFSQKVNVTCVQNPHKFYVQNQCFRSIVNELCQDEGKSASEPVEVKIGQLYLGQPTAEHRWYRIRVLARHKHSKKYEVIFIDYGRMEDVTRAQIRVLSDELKRFSPGAYECSLYDLIPADGGKKWSPEARQIMIDFIDNKQMIMYLVEDSDEDNPKPMQVDLILQSVDSPKSLRCALMYLNLAKQDPKPPKRSEDCSRKIEQLEKTLLKWISEYKRRFIPRELEKDDVFRAKITYSCSPSEFYIRKIGWQQSFEKMQHELEQYCTKEAKIAYQPHVGMVCAFAEQDADEGLIWKRGRVLKIAEAHCEIASVDTGHRLMIPWLDIRYVPKQFTQQPEFAVCCKLMHIQPFKQHSYRWTEEATREFNRIANSSSVFQIIVGSREEERFYDVALYIVKKYNDICVNGLMVKNGLAVSTGSESAVVERSKVVLEDQQPAFEATGGGSSSTKITANRTIGSKSSTSEKRQTRVRVEILRVVSPGEFYVTLTKHASGIARMQEEIQNKMDDKMDDGDEQTSWKKGDLCLVFPTSMAGNTNENDAMACEWYRARVLEVVDDSNYTVFLIDKARTLNVHYSNMSPIPSELKQVHPGAIRCFLACIGPTGNQDRWSSSVMDAFRVAIDKFENFAISLHGRSVNDALPVILWGLMSENVKALSPQLFQYANINNNLVQYGYVHLKEKFQPVSAAASVEEELMRQHSAFNRFLDDLDVEMEEPSIEPSYSGSCDTYQEDLTDEPTPIDRWLPAKPIDKTIFVGTPTYVDNNAVIYLHDVEKERTLTALKKVINEKFSGSQQMPSDKFYSNGEPCLARYHVDDQFYRAVVRKAISPSRYKVQFIDYGNIEECDVKDLRKNVICGRVPTLVNRYRLSDIAPKEDVWPTETLDIIHSLIVGKACQVRVDTDMDTDSAGVVPCFLKVTGEIQEGVSEFLLGQNLAIKSTSSLFEEKVDSLYDPYTNLAGTSKDSFVSPKKGGTRIAAKFATETTESESIPFRDLRDRINQRELDEVFELVAAEQTRTNDEDVDSEDGTGIDLNKVQYFFSYGDIKKELGSDLEDGEVEDEEKKSEENGGTETSSSISFNPNEFDTSTQVDPPLELTQPMLYGYPQFELDESIKGFYCEVTNLINPFNLFVFPQLDDHIQRMKEMMARIQCHARKHRKCSDIEENMPCLAVFKEDNFWYRGVIEEYYADRGEVRIFYVDYLNKEIISVRDILKCPVSLRRIPLRNVQIQLHALRSNPRMRESDVMMKLVELIEGKRIYAKVIKHKPSIEVELYTDAKCTNLIYHKMIKENFFLPGNDEKKSTTVTPTSFSSKLWEK